MEYKDIFGPNLGSVKVKMMIISSPAAAVTRITIPPEIKDIYMNTDLLIEIMFLNKVIFMTKISNKLKLITTKYISIRIQEAILSMMK